jgi:hypothetical protein
MKSKNMIDVHNISEQLTRVSIFPMDCSIGFVFGSIATSLGKNGDAYHTHAWTLYVRPPSLSSVG